MFDFIFGKSHGNKIIAVADIGSGSAAVAIIALEAHGQSRVIAAHRSFLSYEERTEEATIAGIAANLSEAGQKTLAMYANSPYKGTRLSGVYGIIRAPWTQSKTVRSSSLFTKETLITNNVVNGMAQNIIANDTGLDHAHIIESSVVRVELNGYVTARPIGKSAHSIAVAALLSDCNPRMHTSVVDVLGRTFVGKKPLIRSGARALIGGMHDVSTLSGGSSDYVIVDVESEITNILVVREGLTTDHVVVPEGVRTILKRISEKRMPEETLSLIRMIERNECSGDACDTITKEMAQAETDLVGIFVKTFSTLGTPLRLPALCILITHPDIAPWLAAFFSRIDFTQCTLSSRPFSVHVLTAHDMSHGVVPENGVVADIELLVACTLVNIEARA